ncbi:NAD(P)-binding protein [Ramaria rubella]|nr:NAD(P)-binding protein [Ramaria rubella]
MAPINNPRVLFNQYPTGYPVPGETTVYDTTAQIDLDAPIEGGILIKVLVLSIDPYQRGRMRKPTGSSYVGGFVIGQPISNFGVGVVLRSENPKVKTGDHVYGVLNYETYSVIQDVSSLRVLNNPEKLPWSTFVGIAGMTGQTAYVGMKLFSKAKKGETIFVTAAGGAVGATVLQIAKSEGLKVIASAGSDEKVAFAKELGADVAFNYKTKDTRETLQELGHGIDIYWDNTLGETLEIAIDALNTSGRIINCGSISGYNDQERYGVKNLGLIVGKRLSLNGFIVSDHQDLHDEFYGDMPNKVASGLIKHREHIYRGLKEAGQAILDVLKGDNKGKVVIVVTDE